MKFALSLDAIPGAHQDGACADGLRCFEIPLRVTDNRLACKFAAKLGLDLQQQAWPRFPAPAIILRPVWADEDPGQFSTSRFHTLLHPTIDLGQSCFAKQASADPGLVTCYHHCEACLRECRDGIKTTRQR